MPDSKKNHDIIQELFEDDHRALFHTIKQLTNILKDEASYTDRDIDTHTIKSLVFALQNRLLTHFQLESNMEILSDLMEQIPSCKEQAEKIFSEHQFFIEIIDSIYHTSLKLQPQSRNLLTELIDKFDLFKQRIKKHEKEEDHLIKKVLIPQSNQKP